MSESNLPPIVSSGTSLQEAIALLSRAETDYLLAVDAGQLVGWLTAKDVVKLVAQGATNQDCRLGAVITQPYHVLNPEEAEDLPLVWQYFQTYQVWQLPVVGARGEFLGLVKIQEVLQEQTKYVEVLKQQFNHSSLAQTESSYLLKEITNFYPGIIYIYDVDNQRIVYNSESMSGFLGYAKEEIGRRGNEILVETPHPEELELISDQMAEVKLLADGEVKQFEYRAYAVDRNMHWLQNDVRVFLRKPDGEAKLLVGFVQDISDRKATEAELRQKKLELEAVFMAMPDLWFSLDADGTYLQFYSAPEQELYRPVNQLIGKKVTEVLPDYLAKKLLEAVRQVLATKEIATIEYELEVPLGIQFYDCKIICLTENQTLLIAHNITARKNMEQLLRQSNAALEVKIVERTQSLWKANVKLAHQIEEKINLQRLSVRVKFHFGVFLNRQP
ncbi:MAG: PAS domain-containing protein [Coleofasciculaceae cyanobacterium SM2_1_6]|nr:PAS domain-containing protein [Coleofasciculaceae cyanobacterium SM2_1_6]